MQGGVKRTHRQCNEESEDLEAEARRVVRKARRVVPRMKDKKQTSPRFFGIPESRQWSDEEFTDFVLDKPVPAFRLSLVCTQPHTAEYLLYPIGICTKRPVLRFVWELLGHPCASGCRVGEAVSHRLARVLVLLHLSVCEGVS